MSKQSRGSVTQDPERVAVRAFRDMISGTELGGKSLQRDGFTAERITGGTRENLRVELKLSQELGVFYNSKLEVSLTIDKEGVSGSINVEVSRGVVLCGDLAKVSARVTQYSEGTGQDPEQSTRVAGGAGGASGEAVLTDKGISIGVGVETPQKGVGVGIGVGADKDSLFGEGSASFGIGCFGSDKVIAREKTSFGDSQGKDGKPSTRASDKDTKADLGSSKGTSKPEARDTVRCRDVDRSPTDRCAHWK